MITTTIETITPEKAQEYLERNTKNRVINSRNVAALVRDIKTGSFYLTHQGIAFYDDGTLADGQHRLMAVVMAGIPVQMMVTRNMPRDTKIAIDYGVKRRYEDSVDIEDDTENAMLRNSRVVGMIRALWRSSVNGTDVPTNHEIKKIISGIHEPVGIMYRASINRTRPPVAFVNAAGLAAAINGVSEEVIHSFFSVFLYGDSSESEGYNISAPYNWSKKLTEARLRHVSVNRDTVFKGTQNAIYQYIAGDAVKAIKVPKHDRYPVRDKLEAILKGE